jgi:hypothetical protein
LASGIFQMLELSLCRCLLIAVKFSTFGGAALYYVVHHVMNEKSYKW